MSQMNSIAVSIPEADLAEIRGAIGVLKNKLAPAYLDFGAMETDVKAVEVLREINQGLAPLEEALSDSLILSGSEAYQGALLFYGNVKAAAKAKTPGASAIYDDLSARFPGVPQKKKV